MKPVYFFLGANSEEGFFSLYDQLLGGRLEHMRAGTVHDSSVSVQKDRSVE